MKNNSSGIFANTVLADVHACHAIYRLGSQPIYGEIDGVCRITGQSSKGLAFDKWVKPTFTDLAYLLPGNIICNEALFCFDEASKEIQTKTGKDKLQRFRTYSHVIAGGEWKCYTKANKKEIYQDIINGAELVCLTDSGQKHILFKHRIGMWQLDELFITPDIELFSFLHNTMCSLLAVGFNQAAIIEGKYNVNFIVKNGFDTWKVKEDILKNYRGTPIFNFAAWMLFKND